MLLIFTIAAVHVRPGFPIALAALVLLWTLWYWLRLGRPDVPTSRRRIRRFSMAVMLLSLPIFVTALSFIDPDIEQIRYIRTWTVALGMVGLVIISAVIDAMNNLRLHARMKQEAMHDTAAKLAGDLKRRKRDEERFH